MEYDPSQVQAFHRIGDWYMGPKRIYKLVGPAGSGKTTLVLPLVNEILRLPIYSDRETLGGCRVMAYTNRAARVLKSKGIPARTIHSFAGHPPPELPDDPLIKQEYELLKQKLIDSQDAAIEFQKRAQRDLDQFLNKHATNEEDREFALDPQSILADTDLVVADEMSMINEEMGQIIENQCRKLLILGDPLQLGPPSTDGSYFFPRDATYDHELTTIHRQGAGKLAEFLQGLRDRKHIDYVRYCDDRFAPEVHIYRGRQPHIEALRMADIAIARTHEEVFQLNQDMRKAKLGNDIEGRPQAGEPMIALRHNMQRMLFKNDFVAFDERPEYDEDEKMLRGVVRNDAGYAVGDPALVREGVIPKMLVMPEFFTDSPGKKGQSEWKKVERIAKWEKRWPGTIKLAFGHAVTAYQSQGGEWDNVLVKFRSFWRRNATAEEQAEIDESDFRTLYTSVSRARKRVFLYL